MAGREGKRGVCQTFLVLVWRETGAVRNACRRRGQAASTRKRAEWNKDAEPLGVGLEGELLECLEWNGVLERELCALFNVFGPSC